MKSAVSYLYCSGPSNIQEREQKRQWRKTYDPSNESRRSRLSMFPARLKRESMLGVGRVTSIFKPRDSVMLTIAEEAYISTEKKGYYNDFED